MPKLSFALFFILSTLCLSALAQNSTTAQVNSADRFIGQVAFVDAENLRVILKQDQGGVIDISLNEKTSLLRVQPGETDLQKGTRIRLSDLAAGDRLLALGQKSENGRAVNARTVIVINKTDLVQKQQRDQEDWQTRGITGSIVSVDRGSSTFAVSVADKRYTVHSTEKTEYRRYAPDSMKFSDSEPSSFSELKTGDQIRIAGEKDEQKLTMTAERIVFGSLERVVGKINSVRPEMGEIRITELLGSRMFIIHVTPRSNTRQLPEQLANVIAQRLVANTRGTIGQPPTAARARVENGRFAGGDISQLLDRLPQLSISDLKPGTAIVVSGSPDVDTKRITAVTIVSGIEAIVDAVPNVLRDVVRGWNFGGGDLMDLPQ